MTERNAAALSRSAKRIRIGDSEMQVNGNEITARFDEVAVPLPRRVRGEVRISRDHPINQAFALSPAGGHTWWPIATNGRIEVEFDSPKLSWSGHAYVDSNHGDTPLETAFRYWNWSRSIGTRVNHIIYDVLPYASQGYAMSLRIAPDGTLHTDIPAFRTRLPNAPLWRMPRSTRSTEIAQASVLKTFEDTPFYARSLISHKIGGDNILSMHESLSLERFGRPIVQAMLPFRMPRALKF